MIVSANDNSVPSVDDIHRFLAKVEVEANLNISVMREVKKVELNALAESAE